MTGRNYFGSYVFGAGLVVVTRVPETFTGDAAGTQAAGTGAATGVLAFTGPAAGIQAAGLGAATGTETFSGDAAGTQATATGDAAGTQNFYATVAGSQTPATGDAGGTVGGAVGTHYFGSYVFGAGLVVVTQGPETFTGGAAGTQTAGQGEIIGFVGDFPITATGSGAYLMANRLRAKRPRRIGGYGLGVSAQGQGAARATLAFGGLVADTTSNAIGAARGHVSEDALALLLLDDE